MSEEETQVEETEVEETEVEETVEKAPAKKAPAKEAPAKEAPQKKKPETQSQIIYIGKKNTITYVLVAVTILNKSDKCFIQARGRQISKAVDVAEISRRKFLKDNVTVEDVIIGSEELESDIEGMPTKTVSTVEIILKKSQ